MLLMLASKRLDRLKNGLELAQSAQKTPTEPLDTKMGV
jgi:hypothetical protein